MRTRKENPPMTKLAIIGTVVTVGALGLVGQAVAKPTAAVRPLPASVVLEQGQSQRLDASKPAFGMTPAEYHALMVRSEALNRKYGLGTAALTLERGSSERFAIDNPSRGEPVTSTPTDTSTGFAWDDAGIGSGEQPAAKPL